jgi:hypothetical protein
MTFDVLTLTFTEESSVTYDFDVFLERKFFLLTLGSLQQYHTGLMGLHVSLLCCCMKDIRVKFVIKIC